VPLLVLLGLPPTVANATNRVGVLVQSTAAMAGFHRERVPGIQLGLQFLPAALLGSWLGAVVAARLPEAVFGRAFGIVMLLALPLIVRNPRPRSGSARRLPLPLQLAIYFSLGFYGGAFQAGIGIPLLLALVGAAGLDLVRAGSGGYVASRFGSRVGEPLIRPVLTIAVIGLAARLLIAPT
jgi:uncharacterized membrane protein YfcA